MKTRALAITIRLAVAICLLMGLHCQSLAQGVFKCMVMGKTVYQSTPCVGQGKELEIAPGPSEQQMQEAKMRANADKARAGADQAPTAQTPGDQPMGRKVDCAKLNKERGDAFGHRNATVRDSRDTNINQSAAIDQYHEDIRRIESQMVKAGCNPT